MPESISTSKGSSSSVVDTIIDTRDDKGNITEYHNQSGVNTCLIWGYNKTQLLAKIDNNTSFSVPITTINTLQSLSNADNDHCTSNPCSGNEEALRVALNNLRTAYPNAMITTYTYDPLIGVTSITDAKGHMLTYEYDTFNRLKWVKDKNGNIMSQNQYNYKN